MKIQIYPGGMRDFSPVTGSWAKKKIFIVAGELSGDKIGAWYLEQLREQNKTYEVHAVGGTFLKQAGAKLFERYEKLNVVGIVEIIKHLRFLLSFLLRLAKHIVRSNIDELVVVDFPGFNLRLIKKVKRLKPELKITYVSPPQLWAWGERRIKYIKRYCDDVVVIYPFEVSWFEERGVTARWIGYPFYTSLAPYLKSKEKDPKKIALIPASRAVELKTLTPIFAQAIHKLKLVFPDVQIVVPLAESIKKSDMMRVLRSVGLKAWGKDICIVCGEQEKLKALKSCSVAIAKPGTVTLELAFLGVPTIVAYKTSWLSYSIARLFVRIKYMALPNLLLESPVYAEYIQSDCRGDKLGTALLALYRECREGSQIVQARQRQFAELRKMLREIS